MQDITPSAIRGPIRLAIRLPIVIWTHSICGRVTLDTGVQATPFTVAATTVRAVALSVWVGLGLCGKSSHGIARRLFEGAECAEMAE